MIGFGDCDKVKCGKSNISWRMERQDVDMNKVYGVALIGCGHMGEAHMEKIYAKENVSVKCVCDLNVERAKIFQRKYGAERIETDYRRCINAPDVDIVVIVTYPSTHLEIVKYCIEHKKHVICEKPMTQDLESGRELVRLVKENPDVKVLIGYILRHNETYNRVAQMIHDGAIGHPIIMRMAQNHHTMDWPKYLSLIRETSPIIDCGVHYIDVMQWFSGAKITNVDGIGQKTSEDVPEGKYNYGLMTARLSDGSVAYYEAGWANTMSSDNLKEFIGPKGRIRLVYRKDRHFNKEEGDLLEYYRYPEKTYETMNIDCDRKPTDRQFDWLVKMIEEDAPANPSIDEVYDTFRVAVEADEAIRDTLKKG